MASVTIPGNDVHGLGIQWCWLSSFYLKCALLKAVFVRSFDFFFFASSSKKSKSHRKFFSLRRTLKPCPASWWALTMTSTLLWWIARSWFEFTAPWSGARLRYEEDIQPVRSFSLYLVPIPVQHSQNEPCSCMSQVRDSSGHSMCPGVSWSQSVPFAWWSGHAWTCRVHPGVSWSPGKWHRSWPVPWNTRIHRMARGSPARDKPARIRLSFWRAIFSSIGFYWGSNLLVSIFYLSLNLSLLPICSIKHFQGHYHLGLHASIKQYRKPVFALPSPTFFFHLHFSRFPTLSLYLLCYRLEFYFTVSIILPIKALAHSPVFFLSLSKGHWTAFSTHQAMSAGVCNAAWTLNL